MGERGMPNGHDCGSYRDGCDVHHEGTQVGYLQSIPRLLHRLKKEGISQISKKKGGMERMGRQGNSLARPIHVVCRWLLTTDLALSTEETGQPDRLSPPPRLLKFVIIEAGGRRGFGLHWGKAIPLASRTNGTGHARQLTAAGRERGGWRGRGRGRRCFDTPSEIGATLA